jgi:hypothetical protein
MYLAVLVLHSWLRWFVLAAGIATFVAAIGRGDLAARNAQRWSLSFMIALDVQLLLGLLLYGSLSPFTARAMQDFGGAMQDPQLRFWAVEHFTMMLLAAIVAHVGRIFARKAVETDRKRKLILISTAVALLLVLVAIPWPGMPAGRPLFRM